MAMDAHFKRSEETALVVFSGQTDLRYLKYLRPGFRHCFVILRTPERWISIDPLAHMTHVGIHTVPQGPELPEVLREHGLTVIETSLRDAPLATAPPMLWTCVEMVKRILGVQAWHVVTPWQLYKYLTA